MKSNGIMNNAARFLNSKLVDELRDQGHYLTGSLERSINGSYGVINGRRKTEAIGYALDYAIKLNDPQHELKNLPTVGELVKYFLLRGLPIMEAKRAAFNTRKKQEKEGMPTKASSRFSKTGVRTQFIDRAWRTSEQKVDSMVDAGMDRIFDEEFKKQKTERI